jgi:hypothetical protein
MLSSRFEEGRSSRRRRGSSLIEERGDDDRGNCGTTGGPFSNSLVMFHV